MTALEKGDLPEAEEALKRCVKLAPLYAPARRVLGRCLAAQQSEQDCRRKCASRVHLASERAHLSACSRGKTGQQRVLQDGFARSFGDPRAPHDKAHLLGHVGVGISHDDDGLMAHARLEHRAHGV